jgi:hypothetical protein
MVASDHPSKMTVSIGRLKIRITFSTAFTLSSFLGRGGGKTRPYLPLFLLASPARKTLNPLESSWDPRSIPG